MSGVTVATIIKSTSSPLTPLCLRHCSIAFTDKSLLASHLAAMRRSRIPVRSRIHSSDVSTIFDRSSLVSFLSGTYMPTPEMQARLIVNLLYSSLLDDFHTRRNVYMEPLVRNRHVLLDISQDVVVSLSNRLDYRQPID